MYSGNDQWRLSSAFDINPSPSRHRILETGIIQGGAFDASLDIAIDACELFDLASSDARQQANSIATTIAGNWKEALRAEGVTVVDAKNYSTAFEHADAEKALSLTW